MFMYSVLEMMNTSADDLKISLANAAKKDPERTAKRCLFALLDTRGNGKKTHRKHIANALRQSIKIIEQDN